MSSGMRLFYFYAHSGTADPLHKQKSAAPSSRDRTRSRQANNLACTGCVLPTGFFSTLASFVSNISELL